MMCFRSRGTGSDTGSDLGIKKLFKICQLGLGVSCLIAASRCLTSGTGMVLFQVSGAKSTISHFSCLSLSRPI